MDRPTRKYLPVCVDSVPNSDRATANNTHSKHAATLLFVMRNRSDVKSSKPNARLHATRYSPQKYRISVASSAVRPQEF